MKNPTQYKKGRMGYLLDLRKAVKHLSEVCNEWCKAFDAGDEEAFESLGQIMSDTLKDIVSANDALAKFGE